MTTCVNSVFCFNELVGKPRFLLYEHLDESALFQREHTVFLQCLKKRLVSNWGFPPKNTRNICFIFFATNVLVFTHIFCHKMFQFFKYKLQLLVTLFYYYYLDNMEHVIEGDIENDEYTSNVMETIKNNIM